MTVLLAIAVAAGVATSAYASSGNASAQVNILLPPNLVGQLGPITLGGGSGNNICDPQLADCGVPVGANTLAQFNGYWLFATQVTSGSVSKTYDSSNICTIDNTGACPAGITCISAGGLDKWVFNATDFTYIHYTNVMTGSDFNDAGYFTLFTNGIVEFHQTRKWSCAHAVPISEGQAGYNVNSIVYANYLIQGSNIAITATGNSLPAPNPTTYVTYTQITMTQMYNQYSLGSVCQDCICICFSGGNTNISPPDSYTICVSCTVTCRSPTDGSCVCVCATECSEFNSIMIGPFLPACSGLGRRESDALLEEMRRLLA